MADNYFLEIKWPAFYQYKARTDKGLNTVPDTVEEFLQDVEESAKFEHAMNQNQVFRIADYYTRYSNIIPEINDSFMEFITALNTFAECESSDVERECASMERLLNSIFVLSADVAAFATLAPFIRKAIKQQGHQGKKLGQLTEVHEDGSPTIWAQILAAARQEKDLVSDVPKSAAKRAEAIEYPLDKVNGQIWRLLEKDTNGQITFAMESQKDKRKGKEVDLIYAIDFDSLGDDITITKRLLPFDKRVYISISALFNAGNDIMSLTQIYYAMGYTGRPGETDLERISNSISKMSGAKIFMNNTQEAQKYKYDRFVYDGPLLPIERNTAIINGKLADAAIHIFREPPVISFAKQRNQITTINVKLLQTALSKTDANLLLEDYMIERLARAKNGKGQNRILYKTIYEHIGLENETPTNQRNIKKRLPAKVEKYLEHYKQCNYIAKYTMDADGITAYFH